MVRVEWGGAGVWPKWVYMPEWHGRALGLGMAWACLPFGSKARVAWDLGSSPVADALVPEGPSGS